VSIDEHPHVALPKLVGAPAYARPSPPVAHTPRPFDPDDFPISAYQTDDERRLLDELPARAYAPGGGFVANGPRDRPANGHHRATLQARPFRLKTLAGKILKRDA
jgi:hypothetical protein